MAPPATEWSHVAQNKNSSRHTSTEDNMYIVGEALRENEMLIPKMFGTMFMLFNKSFNF